MLKPPKLEQSGYGSVVDESLMKEVIDKLRAAYTEDNYLYILRNAYWYAEKNNSTVATILTSHDVKTA